MSRFPFASLDLSLLPPPQAIHPVDYEAVLAARKADLIARFNAAGIAFDVQSLETDPSIIHQEADAYREILDLQAINDAVAAVLLASASGADLDNLAALVGLRRLTLAPANTTVYPPTPAVMESDDDFRARCRIALDATAVGLTGNGYRTIALQAAPSVRDVGLVKKGRGMIDVILLGRAPDGTVSDADVATVNARLQADDGGQLTDIVTVRSVAPLPYDVAVDAVIPPGPAPSIVQAAAQTAIRGAAATLQTIGGRVPTDALIAAGRVPPISKFTLVSPAIDVVAAPDQAPWLRSATVDLTVAS
jgi:phage-related baseplate assembly protein